MPVPEDIVMRMVDKLVQTAISADRDRIRQNDLYRELKQDLATAYKAGGYLLMEIQAQFGHSKIKPSKELQEAIDNAAKHFDQVPF